MAYLDYFASHEDMKDFPYKSVGLLHYSGFNDETKVYGNFRATAFCANLDQFYPQHWKNKKNVILTSAHCLVKFDDEKGKFKYSKDIKFYLAAYNNPNGEPISEHGTFQQLQGGEGVAYFIHPKFTKFYDERSKYDIAAILLDRNEKGEELFDVVEPLNLVLFNELDTVQSPIDIDDIHVDDIVQNTLDEIDQLSLDSDVDMPDIDIDDIEQNTLDEIDQLSLDSDVDIPDIDNLNDVPPVNVGKLSDQIQSNEGEISKNDKILATAIGYPSSINQHERNQYNMRICTGSILCSDVRPEDGNIFKFGGANGGCSGGPWIIKFDDGGFKVVGITSRNIVSKRSMTTTHSISPLLTSCIVCNLFRDYDTLEIGEEIWWDLNEENTENT